MKKNSFSQPFYFSDRRNPAQWLVLISVFIAGVAVGLGAGRFVPSRGSALVAYPVREKGSSTYKFIDPLLTFETPESNAGSALVSLKSAIGASVAGHIRNHDADHASVYVRTLKSGRWISVNPDERYNPASLLKVPTMIAFYKLAESYPEILSKEVFYAGGLRDNNAEHFKPARAIEPGTSYTVDELIHAMIAYSDNNATHLLHDNINPVLLEKVYNDLGVSISDAGTQDDFMTVSQYTYFFRVLYNATYLNRALSEKAMGLLSMSDFMHGIETGASTTTVVAHKFGERSIADAHGTISTRELHDCGIIYYPQHPYLLCVMTRGSNFDKLAGIIQDISRLVYQDRDRQYRKQ